jgi:DNA polymerase/3'-5' exonuclease PolX
MKPVLAKREAGVFEILGLPWIDPMFRNADA